MRLGKIRAQISHQRSLRESGLAVSTGWVLLLGGILLATASPASADLPRISAGLGYGVGGLFHDEYVEEALRSSGMGRFSAGVYWAELGYLLSSRMIVGLRAHMLRVPIADGIEVGRIDVLPATIFLGYRRPALVGHLGAFVGGGIGIASVNFTPAETIDHWKPWGRDAIEISDSHPVVLELLAGVGARVSTDFSVEMAVSSTLMDADIAFRPRALEGSEEGFAPGHSYRVKSRHLALTLGLRWWVELW